MIKKFLDRARKQQAVAVSAPPVDDAPPARYRFMDGEEARATLLRAVLDGDMGVAESIAYYHPDCHNWIITAKGASIGGEAIFAPILHYATDSNDPRMLNWLIARGADLEARDNVFKCTALYRAAEWGKAAVVAALLKAGADPFTQTQMGIRSVSADHIATDRGFADVAAIIVAAQQSRMQPRVLTAPKLPFAKKR